MVPRNDAPNRESVAIRAPPLLPQTAASTQHHACHTLSHTSSPLPHACATRAPKEVRHRPKHHLRARGEHLQPPSPTTMAAPNQKQYQEVEGELHLHTTTLARSTPPTPPSPSRMLRSVGSAAPGCDHRRPLGTATTTNASNYHQPRRTRLGRPLASHN